MPGKKHTKYKAVNIIGILSEQSAQASNILSFVAAKNTANKYSRRKNNCQRI